MNATGHFVCVQPYTQATVPLGNGAMVPAILFALESAPQNKKPAVPSHPAVVRVQATWYGHEARDFCNAHAAHLCNGGTVYAELQNVRSVGACLLASVTRMRIESPPATIEPAQ